VNPITTPLRHRRPAQSAIYRIGHPLADSTRLYERMSSASELRATIVVGNPKPASRTRSVGVRAAGVILRRAGVPAPADVTTVIELSELAGRLFTWGDPAVAAAKDTVLASHLLVVAAPVYKASYPGLLKAFLDQFGRDELRALATVPLMVGAAALHSMAIDSQLRPVLVEIGASCPTRGIYILEKDIEADGGTQVDVELARWSDMWGDVLVRVVEAGLERKEKVT
jgi:FMN reductase